MITKEISLKIKIKLKIPQKQLDQTAQKPKMSSATQLLK